MKILIVHGWMHNAKLYESLKIELEKSNMHDVELYELPGFGVTKAKYFDNVISSYSNDLSSYLNQHDFDYIIGHSLGGNVILRASCIKKINSKLILLSPMYNGVGILFFVMPLLWLVPTILRLLKHKNCITDFIIKTMSLFTINTWNCITDDILVAAREADPYVATNLIKEMYKDNWEINRIDNEVYLILGEKDRVIAKNKMDKLRKSSLHMKCFEIEKIGHTAVLEAFNKLALIINEILNEESE